MDVRICFCSVNQHFNRLDFIDNILDSRISSVKYGRKKKRIRTIPTSNSSRHRMGESIASQRVNKKAMVLKALSPVQRDNQNRKKKLENLPPLSVLMSCGWRPGIRELAAVSTLTESNDLS